MASQSGLRLIFFFETFVASCLLILRYCVYRRAIFLVFLAAKFRAAFGELKLVGGIAIIHKG